MVVVVVAAVVVVVVVVVKASFSYGNHVTWYIVIFNGPSSPNTLTYIHILYTYNKASDKIY